MVQVASLVEKMEDMFEGNADEYPIVSTTAKKFKSRLVEFWTRLVDKMQHGVLFDDIVMPELIKVWRTCIIESFFLLTHPPFCSG